MRFCSNDGWVIFFFCDICVMEYYVGVKKVGEMNREGIIVVHMCNPITRQVEAGGLPWTIEQFRLQGDSIRGLGLQSNASPCIVQLF